LAWPRLQRTQDHIATQFTRHKYASTYMVIYPPHATNDRLQIALRIGCNSSCMHGSLTPWMAKWRGEIRFRSRIIVTEDPEPRSNVEINTTVRWPFVITCIPIDCASLSMQLVSLNIGDVAAVILWHCVCVRVQHISQYVN